MRVIAIVNGLPVDAKLGDQFDGTGKLTVTGVEYDLVDVTSWDGHAAHVPGGTHHTVYLDFEVHRPPSPASTESS